MKGCTDSERKKGESVSTGYNFIILDVRRIKWKQGEEYMRWMDKKN